MCTARAVIIIDGPKLPFKKKHRQGGVFLGMKSLKGFKNSCGTHAGTDAHGDHAVFGLGALHAVHDGRGADGASGTQRMAERDGTSAGIDLGSIQFAVADDR